MEYSSFKRHTIAKVEARVLKSAVYIGAILTAIVVGILLAYITVKGVINITPGLFSLHYTSDNASLIPALVNTIILLVLTLLIAVPIGIGASVYLVEYAKSSSLISRFARIMAQTLQAIPSIVYGLFGYMFFAVALGWKLSLLSGASTLSLMILPLIMRTSEEALLAVPKELQEAALALGASKLHVIATVMLPEAMEGIKSGILLAMGRVIGESAALIYTLGTVAAIPHNLMGGGRTLAVHLYALWCEGLKVEHSYATAFILVLIVLSFNLLARRKPLSKSHASPNKGGSR